MFLTATWLDGRKRRSQDNFKVAGSHVAYIVHV